MTVEIRLVRGLDGARVPGVLVSLETRHLEDFEQQWRSVLREFQAEDKYWDWVYKQRRSSRGNSEAYAIEAEAQTQGMMLLETQQHRSWLDRSQRIVYIESMATAPWNRLNIQNPPRLRGVGTAFLRFSRQRSLELGYGGRVGLHALPMAERFYEGQGMTRCELDAEEYLIDPDEEEALAYFEYGVLRPLN